MDLELNGRRFIVTGGASGIGLAATRALVAEGARVAILDRDDVAGSELEKELRADGAAVQFVATDVTVEESVRRSVESVSSRWAGVDGLICCAGISGPFGVDITEIQLADWNAVMAVNVAGPFLTVKHALPELRAATEPTIVLMASDSSFVAAPGMVAYNASKGAVLQLTRALSVDLAASGIRVNCVCPSIVDTPMSRADLELVELGFDSVDYPVQSAAEVANHLLYLSSIRSRPVNGQFIVSDFGYLARSSFPA